MMLRDQGLRRLFIPLLGILIPFFSGAITYRLYAWLEIVAVQLYFVFVSFSIWQGCHWIHGKLRRLHLVKGSPYPKILSICLISGIYGAAIAGLLFLVWTKLSRERFSEPVMVAFIAFSAFAVVIFTLLYEVLYLSKEREMDRKRVHQLDKEKTWAELQVLHNELDPHFLFNALTSLSYLIRHDAEKALHFDKKLAQVFRYFLQHKSNGLVALEKELVFLEDYFYLLKIRHGEKLQLHLTVSSVANSFIVPCALQILLENAIKHNAFSTERPLCITIEQKEQTLCVRNNRQAKIDEPSSTHIGLANLDQRYRLLCGQHIQVNQSEHEFVVCLPLASFAFRPTVAPILR